MYLMLIEKFPTMKLIAPRVLIFILQGNNYYKNLHVSARCCRSQKNVNFIFRFSKIDDWTRTKTSNKSEIVIKTLADLKY